MSPRRYALFVVTAASLVAARPGRAETLRGRIVPSVEPAPRPSRGPRLELTTGFGVLGRGTTGTIANYGYDAGAAPTVRGNVRVFFAPDFDCNCEPRHGFDLGFVHAGGPSFGLLGEYAYRQYVFDAAYAFHIKLPCMSNEHRQVTLTGLAGLTGFWADAGLGDVSRDETANLNARMFAQTNYDHAALGWRFGTALDVRFGAFVLGVEVNLRDLYGIGGGHARSFLMEAGLRVGAQIPLTPAPRVREYPYRSLQ